MGSFSPTIANNPITQQPDNGSTPIGALGSAMSTIGGSGKSGGFNNTMQSAGNGFQQQGQGKFGGQIPQPTTNSATSGQPQMGDPSQNPQSSQMFQPQRNFPNTIQQVDNTGNTGNTTNQPMSAGKGKGA